MTKFSAQWDSPESDPEDIYGRPLEDIVLTADVDDMLTVKYSIEFRRDQTYYGYDEESAIKLYEAFVFDKPEYAKAARQLFDELINDMAAEAAESEDTHFVCEYCLGKGCKTCGYTGKQLDPETGEPITTFQYDGIESWLDAEAVWRLTH